MKREGGLRARPFCYCVEPREAIERALQDIGGGVLVDHLGAACLRLMSAAISSRSTAAVDSRSSHSAIGSGVSLAKLRAKARVDCARGPSEPSMLTGRPSTKPMALRSAASASRRRGVGGEIRARDGLDAGRQLAVGIARGDADGLGAEIEADQAATRGQKRRDIHQRADRHLSVGARRPLGIERADQAAIVVRDSAR